MGFWEICKRFVATAIFKVGKRAMPFEPGTLDETHDLPGGKAAHART
jgi:hypothetical protein